MKKILYFAATVAAVVAFAACNFADIDTQSPTDYVTSFVKGQKVTLTVGTGTDTKVTGTLDEETGAIDFKWEKGDKIKVSVGGKSSEFTLVGDGGSTTGEFEGEMPADGDSFDVQYPVNDPDLATQTYSATEALPHDKMKFTATDCTLGNSFTLAPQNAAFRVNLYGIERKVSKILVHYATPLSTSWSTYTLNISPAVTISNDKNSPTPFFIVVSAGSDQWIVAEVISEAVAPSTYILPKYPNNTEPNYGSGILIVNNLFTPSSAITFTAGSILNWEAYCLTTIWAPVNCGYDATNYPMGLLYQWGRKYGQEAYETGTITPTSMSKSDDTEENKGMFGLYNETDYNWFSDGVDNTLWNDGTKGAKDPCPEGWRVPTMYEFEKLIGGKYGNWGATIFAEDSGNWDGKGYWFNGTDLPEVGDGVFLPAAGYNDIIGSHQHGDWGRYWSSSVFEESIYAFFLEFDYATARATYLTHRAYGFSVRCIQE